MFTYICKKHPFYYLQKKKFLLYFLWASPKSIDECAELVEITYTHTIRKVMKYAIQKIGFNNIIGLWCLING